MLASGDARQVVSIALEGGRLAVSAEPLIEAPVEREALPEGKVGAWVSRLLDENATPDVSPPALKAAYESVFRPQRKARDLQAPQARFIRVAPGSFDMNGTSVKLRRPYELLEDELTQQQVLKLLGRNPSLRQGDLRRPADNLNWFDGAEAANALSRAHGRKPCYEFKRDAQGLPIAARVTSASGKATDCEGYRHANEAELRYAAAVKGGLRNLPGTLWRWAQDWWSETPGGVDPEGPAEGSVRVLLGADSEQVEGPSVAAVQSTAGEPWRRGPSVGVRLARSLP